MTRRVVAVAAVQFVLLSVLAAVLPTWQDEEFTLATTAHGVAYAIHRALTYELQAPLYFAVIAAIRIFASNVFAAREFSVLAAVATTLVAAAIGRRVWPERDPWIFCALVASNPFEVFAAVEIRTYALALLESALLFWAFFEGFLYADAPRARLAFFIVLVAGLYTQYFIGFEAAAFFVALAVGGRARRLPAYVGVCLAAIVVFTPLGLIVRSQTATLSVEGQPRGFGGDLLRPVNFPMLHEFSILGHVPSVVLTWIVRVAVVAAIAFGVPRLQRPLVTLGSLWLTVVAIYSVLTDVLNINLIPPRHFLSLALPEFVATYALAAAFGSPRARASAIALAVALGVSNAVTLASTYTPPAKLGDARRVGDFLNANVAPADTIAIYPGDAVAPVARYFTKTVPLLGYPVPTDQVNYQVDAAFVRSPAEASAAFGRLPKTNRLWFAMEITCQQNIHGCDYVLAEMSRRYTIVSRHEFVSATVFELERR